MGGVWRKFRGWPLWAQIVVGFVLVGAVAAPFSNRDNGQKVATVRPSATTTSIAEMTTSSEFATTTTPTTALATTAPTATATTARAVVATHPTAPATTRTTAPPGPSGHCDAHMSNPTPGQGGSETAIIDSNVPNMAVTVTVHYKTTSSTFNGQTDAYGHSEVTFSIGHPSAGYTVRVDVNISGKAMCSTSFTPQ